MFFIRIVYCYVCQEVKLRNYIYDYILLVYNEEFCAVITRRSQPHTQNVYITLNLSQTFELIRCVKHKISFYP